MKRTLSIFSMLLVLAMSSFAQTSLAAGWEVLGEKKVSRRAESDSIRVGIRDGAFRRIQFKVRGADVEFKKVRINYKDGATREIAMRDLIRKGGSSRVIDLPGSARVIDRVNFWYETKGSGRAQASVILLGKSA